MLSTHSLLCPDFRQEDIVQHKKMHYAINTLTAPLKLRPNSTIQIYYYYYYYYYIHSSVILQSADVPEKNCTKLNYDHGELQGHALSRNVQKLLHNAKMAEKISVVSVNGYSSVPS